MPAPGTRGSSWSPFKTLKNAVSSLGKEANKTTKQTKALLAALVAGDEEKALAIYTAVDKAGDSLQFELHPSLPIGNDDDNTPMHYACYGGMKDILLMFIERGGAPNTLNSQDQTCLHAACLGLASMGVGSSGGGGGGGGVASAFSSLASSIMISGGLQSKPKPGMSVEQANATRLFCLEVLLSWQGIEIDGQSEKPAVNAVDAMGCTALHYASGAGLRECCSKLIARGAIVTVVNKAQETPCDVAGSGMHAELADGLEARMIFTTDAAAAEWLGAGAAGADGYDYASSGGGSGGAAEEAAGGERSSRSGSIGGAQGGIPPSGEYFESLTSERVLNEAAARAETAAKRIRSSVGMELPSPSHADEAENTAGGAEEGSSAEEGDATTDGDASGAKEEGVPSSSLESAYWWNQVSAQLLETCSWDPEATHQR